jgi:16S rRNA processing protein RimM
VLTDRPAERFRPGVVLHLEGTSEPLTISSAEPVADGPGWRLIFRQVSDRTAAERLRGAYLEAVVAGTAGLQRGEYLWHEVIGSTVRGVDGADLGRVDDIYRVAETEVLVVRGGALGDFDLPVVRSLIRVFAPRRGEIVVDADALDLASPGEAMEPADRPRSPRRRSRRPHAGAASATNDTVTDAQHPDIATDATATDSAAAEPG